jgi:hypothetical protein
MLFLIFSILSLSLSREIIFSSTAQGSNYTNTIVDWGNKKAIESKLYTRADIEKDKKYALDWVDVGFGITLKPGDACVSNCCLYPYYITHTLLNDTTYPERVNNPDWKTIEVGFFFSMVGSGVYGGFMKGQPYVDGTHMVVGQYNFVNSITTERDIIYSQSTMSSPPARITSFVLDTARDMSGVRYTSIKSNGVTVDTMTRMSLRGKY